jgi:FdhD protein
MENASSTSRHVTRYDGACFAHADDRLAVEEPLAIRVGPVALAVTMRTPGPAGHQHDRELAAGFCLTEGIVTHADEIESVEPCSETGGAKEGNVIVVTLVEPAHARYQKAIDGAKRELYMSSSCGLCGKQTIDKVCKTVRKNEDRFTISRSVLDALPGAMRKAQATFDQTGGLHAAAIFTPTGEVRVLREDVGRHNAVDKAIGHELLLGRSLKGVGLLVSGRSSYEIMQKAAVAGIGLVAAVSAPSSMAVDLAIATDITLIGFLRPGRMNVYHDAGRIV